MNHGNAPDAPAHDRRNKRRPGLRPDHYDCGAACPDRILNNFASFSSPTSRRGANVGFCINYRSTRAVTAAEAEAIDQAASRLCDDDNWGDGCEEICFYECFEANAGERPYAEGHLSGSSKISFNAPEEDAMPGEETRIVTIHDLIDTLCQISRDHQVDWEIGHDYHEGPAGYIRSGSADDKLVAEIDRLSAEIEEARNLG
jgi:hypothetical protein